MTKRMLDPGEKNERRIGSPGAKCEPGNTSTVNGNMPVTATLNVRASDCDQEAPLCSIPKRVPIALSMPHWVAPVACIRNAAGTRGFDTQRADSYRSTPPIASRPPNASNRRHPRRTVPDLTPVPFISFPLFPSLFPLNFPQMHLLLAADLALSFARTASNAEPNC
jgi:hypothetical protein